jgi:thioredoxin reductase
MKLTNRWGICPAVACTIIGADDAALSLAERLPEIGVRVLGLVTESTKIDGDPDRAERIQSRGVPIFLGHRVTQAIGDFHLKGLRLEPVGGGEHVDARCDLVAVSAPGAPSWELAAQAGAEVKFVDGQHGFVSQADAVGRTRTGDVFVTGEMLGPCSPARAVSHGWDAGVAAAFDLRANDPRPAARGHTPEP